jgi:Variant SH3 domain
VFSLLIFSRFVSLFLILRYRAVYAYAPRHIDELEIREGDIIEVMEKCDDGWYVGTSVRTNEFGTFPGNYVQPVD